jgi:UDP-N-acetylmuramate--alanine ligase
VAVAALPTFQGPRRRFETRGRPRGIWLVDDYGHHPTEVAAVLRAARSVAEGQVGVACQPHTTNRTWALFDDFARCFDDAQHALVLPIYRPSGREAAARDVTSEDLVAAIQRHGHYDARYVKTFDAAGDAVVSGARAGDLVLTMGAGDVTLLSGQLLEALDQ